MTYMWVVALAEDLEARALKSSAQTKAPGNTPMRVPRKTGDGACKNTGSAKVGVERIGSNGKTGAFSLFRARPSSRNVPKV